MARPFGLPGGAWWCMWCVVACWVCCLGAAVVWFRVGFALVPRWLRVGFALSRWFSCLWRWCLLVADAVGWGRTPGCRRPPGLFAAASPPASGLLLGWGARVGCGVGHAVLTCSTPRWLLFGCLAGGRCWLAGWWWCAAGGLWPSWLKSPRQPPSPPPRGGGVGWVVCGGAVVVFLGGGLALLFGGGCGWWAAGRSRAPPRPGLRAAGLAAALQLKCGWLGGGGIWD